LPLSEVLLQRLGHALSHTLLYPESLGDGRWDHGGFAYRGQRDEAHTFLELVHDLPCYLETQPSLADSPRTCERQQT